MEKFTCHIMMFLLLMAFHNTESFSQWVIEPIADTFDENLLPEKPLGFDAENNYHLAFLKRVPTGPQGMARHEIWYTKKETPDSWSEPVMVSAEEEETFDQMIAVGRYGEVFIFYSNNDGCKILKKEDYQWNLIDLPFEGIFRSLNIMVDDEGKLHAVFGRKFNVQGSDFELEIIYATYFDNEWEVHHIPDSENSYLLLKYFDIDAEGNLHILYTELINTTDYQIYYLTNQTGEWVKTPILEPGKVNKALGLKCRGTDIHLALQYKESYTSTAEVYYIKISEGQQQIAQLEHDPEIVPYSFAVNQEGIPYFAFTEKLSHNETGALYLGTLQGDEFETIILYDEHPQSIDAYISFDNENNIRVVVALGKYESSIFMMYEKFEFQAEFIISDPDHNPIPDAVVTLGDITNEAGNYIFTGLTPEAYSYSIAREGFQTISGEITITDSDLQVEAQMDYDQTSTGKLHSNFINVFPNPANHHINISSSCVINIVRIYDLTGQELIYTQAQSENITINASGLSSGIYMMVVETTSGITQKKLTISK